jgi:hypothetical protein
LIQTPFAVGKISKIVFLYISFFWPNHPAADLSFLFIFTASFSAH